MWFNIKLFIKNLFVKHNKFKISIHKCFGIDAEYLVIPKYVRKKGGKSWIRVIRYDIYEIGKCLHCENNYKTKIATNITSSRLYNKYDIRIK